MDKAPSTLGDAQSLTRQQFYAEMTKRRNWLQGVTREYGDRKSDMPESTAFDMSRVNAEMDQLLAIGDVKFPSSGWNPAMLPGGGGPSLGSRSVPSPLKAGHWSQPVVDAVQAQGQKALTSGSVVVPSLLPGIVRIPDRPIYLTQVIPSTTLTNTNLYSYLQETVRTHAAAEVSGRRAEAGQHLHRGEG